MVNVIVYYKEAVMHVFYLFEDDWFVLGIVFFQVQLELSGDRVGVNGCSYAFIAFD